MRNTYKLLLVAMLLALVVGVFAGCDSNPAATEPAQTINVQDMPEADPYVYHNPEIERVQPDAGFTIDGVLDEEAYKNANWMWLHNDDGGNNVTIGVTSYWGEKGMYFVYDVTESVPIYVNLNRASYLNSCIEMYLAPHTVTSRKQNSYFEIDLLPTGNLMFKMSNGKDTYNDVTTTHDKSAILGATTKGGDVNTPDCYGYNLELFIPWEYMEWLGMDVQSMKDGYVYVNPAHITSNNLNGTDTNLDRYWYHYAEQQGAGFSQIFQYFRFNADGAMGVVPVTAEKAEGCTVVSDPTAVSGVLTDITVKPEAGKALTSIVINGEEKIGVVSFNEDGSAYIAVRPGNEELKISAAAEDVAAGPYTLSGSINLKRHTGTDTLENTILTYTGPEGEKPIEFAADGSFKVEGLSEGNYIITCEKNGYIKHVRNIMVNRDMEISIPLEYDQFYIEKGTGWILDNQNDGILGRFSGDQAYVMSNDYYEDFTFTATLHYDESLREESTIDAFQSQRSGLRFKFDNERTLHLDLIYENGVYLLQFAKIHNSALTDWSRAGKLDAEQVADLLEDGEIEVKIIRQNDKVAIWAGGKGVNMRDLDDSIFYAKTQVGFENWGANRGMYEVKYDIKPYAEKNLLTAFKPGAQWDSSDMYEGSIASTGYVAKDGNGDTGWLYSELQDYAGSTVWIRDLIGDGHDFRFAVRYEMANGKRYTLTVLNDIRNNKYILQYMNEGVIKNWSSPYTLTAEQVAKIRQPEGGLAFTIVNIDNFMNVYLDGEQVLSVDVSKDTSGEETGIFNTPSTVCYRMYGYSYYQVDFPYIFHCGVNRTQINITGNAVAVGSNHLVGETVVLKGDYDYFLKSAVVDGKEIAADEDGIIRFIATEQTHNVVATTEYRPTYWKDNGNFDLSNQYKGTIVLTSPENADSGYLDSIKNTHRDVSLFIKDNHPDRTGDQGYRASARFNFTNGKDVWLSILHEPKDGNNDRYIVQTMTSSITPAWKNLHTLTAEEAAAVQAGATMRIFIVGNDAVVQLNGKELCVLDLSAGDVADVGAQIRVRMYGNAGDIETIPFTLGGEPTVYTLTDKTGICGSVTTDQKYFMPGDDMELTVQVNSGFVDPVLMVNGEAVELVDGKYTVKNITGNVTAELTATQTEDWTTTSTYWDLSQQKQGILSVPTPNTNGSKGTGWVSTYRNTYRDLSITYGYAAPVSKESYGLGFKLEFANGKNLTYRIINDKENGAGYRFQAMDGNSMIGNWSQIYLFNAEQNAKIASGAEMTFRVAVSGNNVIFFIDGVRVKTLDLSAHNIAGVGFKANVWLYQHVGSPASMTYTLGGEPETGKLNIATVEDGTLTADHGEYIVGEVVTITAVPTTVNPLRWITVDGAKVADTNGKYSFTTTKNGHDIDANFVPDPIWVTTNAEWDVSQQKFGKLTIKGTDNDSGWLDTVKNTYKEFTIHYTNVKENTYENALAFQIQFASGKNLQFRLISDDKNNLDAFRLQMMGNNNHLLGTGWGNIYRLSATQNEKLFAQGIDITVSLLGNDAVFYVDGVRVATYDLSAFDVAGQSFKLRLRSYNTVDVQTPMTFALSETAGAGDLDISALNGTVTPSVGTYRIGESVKLELKGNDGYVFKSLSIDGREVEVTGTSYSFTTTKAAHKVEAVFELTNKIWIETNAEWDTTQQNVGILQVKNPDGDTGWISTNTATYRDMSITFSGAGADTAKEGLQLAFKLEFTNGKVLTYRLINDLDNGATYRLQAMTNGANMIGNWSGIYNLNAGQKAKLLSSQGITLRIVMDGSSAIFMIDGVVVKQYDLSSYNVDGVPFRPFIRLYQHKNADASMAYSLAQTVEHCEFSYDALNDIDQCSLTHPTSYVIGQVITLKVTPYGNLRCQELSLDGKAITLDANGSYSFVATKNGHKLVAKYDEHFTDNAEWDMSKQTESVLSVPACDGDTGWLATSANTYTHMGIGFNATGASTAKEGLQLAFRLDFSNGKVLTFRFINDLENGAGYRLQAMTNGNNMIGNWSGIYTLNAEQEAKLLSDEGIRFDLRVEGNNVHFIIDGVTVRTYDLSSYNVAGSTFKVNVRLYQHKDNPFTMTYVLD